MRKALWSIAIQYELHYFPNRRAREDINTRQGLDIYGGGKLRNIDTVLYFKAVS